MTSESTINLFWFIINVYMNRYLELTYFVTIALYVSESLFYLWQLKNPLCCKNIISESRNSLSLSLSLSFFLSLSSLSPSESRVDLTKVSHILPTKSAAPLSLSPRRWMNRDYALQPTSQTRRRRRRRWFLQSLSASLSFALSSFAEPTNSKNWLCCHPTNHPWSIHLSSSLFWPHLAINLTPTSGAGFGPKLVKHSNSWL